MKRFINILFILLLSMSIFGCSNKAANNEPTNNNNDPGTDVSEEGEWVCTMEKYYHDDGNVECYYINEYDEEGKFVRCEEYDGDGNLMYTGESTYDEKGNEILYLGYDKDGKLIDKTEFEYDNKNQMIKETDYLDENTKGDIYTYEYDENGNAIHIVISSSDGEVFLDTKNEYNVDGKIIKSYEHAEGYVSWTYEYEYNGEFLEKINRFDNNGTLDGIYVYSYKDQNPDLVETVKYCNPDNSLIMTMEHRYDENNNEISYAQFDASGTMMQMIEYEYRRK
ncbi:MAG: hypothetical protein J6S38_08290 [Erysipelotrichaceae bacterium]|nr:hypothetical protein [Erysipelotrichaceae bacterium]